MLIAAAVALSTLRNIDGVDDALDDSDPGKLRDNTYAATGSFPYKTRVLLFR